MKGPKIEKVGGDASARRYYRIKAEERSYILCKDETLSGPENNNLFRNVQKILKSYDIPVPELYDTNLDSSMVLEQDLGDDTLLKMLSSYHDSKKELEIYKSILKIMIKIHTIDSSNHRKEKFTKVLIGGAMANTFLLAEGNEIGLSMHEKKMIKHSYEMLNRFKEKMLFPLDFIVTNKVRNLTMNSFIWVNTMGSKYF